MLQEVDIDELKVRIEGIHRRYAKPITNRTQQDEERKNLDIDNNAGVNSYLLNINVECPSNKLLVSRDKMDKMNDDVVKGAVKDATLANRVMVYNLNERLPKKCLLREIAKYNQPSDDGLKSVLESNYKKIAQKNNVKTWKEKIAEKFTNGKSQVNIIQ